MKKEIDFAQAGEMLARFSGMLTEEQMVSRLQAFAEEKGVERFQAAAADELIRVTRPERLVPAIYSDYRDVVRDGLRFLFRHLAPERLYPILAAQVKLKKDASPEERLVRLAGEIPTLHKLGQIIARNRNIDPFFRHWLIELENNVPSPGTGEIQTVLRREMRNYLIPYRIGIDREFLAEASVGVVIGGHWTAPDTGAPGRAAFKVIKPGVREQLREEFELLDRIAQYFDENRDRYYLKDFRFIETFRDIRLALQEEINLPGEQCHLRAAAAFYGDDPAVHVPRLLPFSTEHITAMEMVDGGKITDTGLDRTARKQLARDLFQAVIWQPLFSVKDETLFHGDPHAGNIYAFRDRDGVYRPALLDWSLGGFLTRTRRKNMVRLILSVLTGDADLICDAVAALSEEGAVAETKVLRVTGEILDSPAYGERPLVDRAFYFIDQSAVRGIRYPADLLLFRKSFFTLDGVLYDLDPDFSKDAYMIRLIEGLVREELPRRWAGMVFPRMDRADQYRSLVTNRDIALFVLQFFMTHMNRVVTALAELAGQQGGILMRQFACLYPQTVLARC